MVKVADLNDQIDEPGSRSFLYCLGCGSEFSAHAEDYFQLTPGHVFQCCDTTMILARKVVTFEEIDLDA